MIRILDKNTADKIAAGEVIDRPVSIVKELLENSLDADATDITVEIKNGGRTYIRVTDNGCGIETDQAELAFTRHATSKISSEEDLDAIHTLGFRGEALASICAVSRVELITKTAGSKTGRRVAAENSTIIESTATGCPEGTTVTVRDLFYNVPARRKFLKKDSSEALACSAVVEKIALSRPDLSVKFVSDGNLRFSTSGDGKLLNAVYAVLGRDFAHRLTEVCGKTNGIGVTGYNRFAVFVFSR